MRHEERDVLGMHAGEVSHFTRAADKALDGKTEDLTTVHADVWIARDDAVIEGGREAQHLFAVVAVSVHAGGENAGIGRGLEHDSARAVAEEHAGGAVLHVEHSGHHLGADHDRGAVGTSAQHGVGGVERIDEARTDRLHVEGRASPGAERSLHAAGDGRKHHVGRRGGHDDQVDFGGLDVRGLKRPAGGGHGQRRRRLALGLVGEMAALDAGARANPLVARLNAVAGEHGRKFPVGDDALRKRTARA